MSHLSGQMKESAGGQTFSSGHSFRPRYSPEPFDPDPNSLPHIARDLSCDLIQQSTKLEVNEAGAKAAAVTDVIVVAYGVAEEKPAPVVVNVNRPFIFSITATDYNIVLFAGAVYEI